MVFRINHIHLKAPDPAKTAEWWSIAFRFRVLSDDLRHFGDRFIRCVSEDGAMGINISGARAGETLGAGDGGVHYGLEHFGIDSSDVAADVARLESLGAKLVEGPLQMPTGARIAFMVGPDEVRFELIQRA